MTIILCILAGGRSSRFGSSKLNVRIGDRPVLAWLTERLGALADEHWLSVAPGAALPPGVGRFDRIVADAVSYRGPLPAMAHVLELAPPRSLVIFTAADMPLVDAAHLRRMIALLRRRRLAGVMSRWTGGDHAGQVEPLPSVWRARRGAMLMDRAITAGVRGPHRLADWPGVGCLPAGGDVAKGTFTNINERRDADGVAARLGRRVTSA